MVTGMNTPFPLISTCLLCLLPLVAQEPEPAVSKEALSVHTVERGNMPLVEQANGSLTSLDPPRATLTFSRDSTALCQPGHSAKVQVNPSPRALGGKVVKGSPEGTKPGRCEIELSEAVPTGASIGQKVEALIAVAELKDVVFLGRPADSSADSRATLFVVEPGSSSARRTTVRYGKRSGPLIQVVEGLAPGDRVIVTDMSPWTAYPRVRRHSPFPYLHSATKIIS